MARKKQHLFLILLFMALLPLWTIGCGAGRTQAPAAETTTAVTASSAVPEAAPVTAETSVETSATGADATDESASGAIDEDGSYTSRDDVALYLHTYRHLPSNFITKNEAMALGWEASKGNLQEVAPGMSIGGDRFGNREGLLPAAPGRQYYECDIDYNGGTRGARRIVYSDDGLIYYTEDHYASYELLYD